MATLGSRGIVKSEQNLIKGIDAIEALTKAIARSGASFLRARNTALINKDAKSIASNSLISLFNTESGLEKKTRTVSDIRRAYGLVGAGKFSNVGEAYSSILQRRNTRKAHSSATSDYFSSRRPGNWMSRFTKQFGAAGRTIAQMEYGDAMLAITDPDKLHKDELRREWGDVRGEALYKAERHRKASEMAKKRRSEARKSAIAADQAFKYDMMSDYERQMHDLTKRYGGNKDRADAKIRQDALKKLPKFMAEMLKGTKINTKALLGLSGNNVISKIAAHPIAGPLAIAGVAAHWINNILDRADKANESIVGWQNAMNLYGKPSERFSNAAYLAGLKDPGKISKLYGQLTMAFGNADMAMSVLGSGVKNLPPIARIAIAKQLGLDEDVFAIMDIMSGRLSPDKARLTNAATKKQAVWKSLADSSTGSLSDTITAISSDALFGITGRIGARTSQEIINEAYSDRVNRQIESAINSYDNAQRSPMPNAGNNSSVSNSSTININGPITLPNVRDANGFVNDIENRASTRRAVLNDNEPTKR